MDAYANFIETAINGRSSNFNIAPEDVNEEMDEKMLKNEDEVEQIVIISKILFHFVNHELMKLQADFDFKSFKEFIDEHMNSAVLFTTGSNANTFYSPDFLFHLKKDFLPHTMLWTEMLLGSSVMHISTSCPKIRCNWDLILITLILTTLYNATLSTAKSILQFAMQQIYSGNFLPCYYRKS